MTSEDLADRLRSERIVPMSEQEWVSVATDFDEVERHDTIVSGTLLIVQTPDGLAAVEQPKASQRVVRLLGNPETTHQFVKERLALYERMWDGCGCKIDYYS